MQVITWNVNSVAARLERLGAFLQKVQPDILCLQELKCVDAKFPFDVVANCGYQALVYGQKTYNGVAILTRAKAEEVVRGMDDGNTEDLQARVLVAKVDDVYVVNIYAPNGQAVYSDKYVFKLEWYDRLYKFLKKRFTPEDRVIICGDYNIAPEDRDVYDPVAWQDSVLCSPPERAALARIQELGYVDGFRLHHPEAGVYSWWDYRQLAFPKNQGLRIDLLLLSKPLVPACQSAKIYRDERKGTKPSDHAPVGVELHLS